MEYIKDINGVINLQDDSKYNTKLSINTLYSIINDLQLKINNLENRLFKLETNKNE